MVPKALWDQIFNDFEFEFAHTYTKLHIWLHIWLPIKFFDPGFWKGFYLISQESLEMFETNYLSSQKE